ncbi:hypothetical protein OIN60_14280 [Paenibacillus sp. P96]|uniref:Spore coat protein n=1 Tax=Paenibacillus zeirhizosphaerae TaxID=2987519 RepID=A0ABT9FTJ4_9BACL|nr:hypothetical protein [Paenibacillus sp. P96]MDP4097940.1 hypothetical protein [Paenibacillus sp. P96]
MDKVTPKEETSYLFNVDVLVKGSSNAVALQSLMEVFNSFEQVADYRVISGIELGKLIETALEIKKKAWSESANTANSLPHGQKTKNKTQNGNKANHQGNTSPKVSAENQSNSMHEWINAYIQKNSLVRLVVNRYGGQRSIPCRIINNDQDSGTLSVYHVDEKQVYTFKMNEIDEIFPT